MSAAATLPRLRVALFGAGARGLQCLGALAGNPRLEVVGFLDNDRRKWGTSVAGLPVHEPTGDRCRDVDAILLASIHAKEILAQLTRLGVADRVVLSPPHLQRRLAGQSPSTPTDPAEPPDVQRDRLLADVPAASRALAARLDQDPPPPQPGSAASARAVACTICGNNYFAYATVLARSFLRQHPGSRFFICLVDRRRDDLPYPDDPRIVVIEAAALGVPEFDRQAFKYDVLEFNTAVKPWFLEALFRAHGVERLLYLDPDILVLDSLAPLYEALAQTPLLLTPHLLSPYRDDHHPREIDILRAGTFNLGFLGLAAHPQTWELLSWWQARLTDGCTRQVEHGYFVDQKWMDLAPSFFPAHTVVRDPGCNAAYWNLHERSIGFADDMFTANGRPLRFFHFSGIDVHDLESVSKHQTRWTLPADGPLRELFELYRVLLVTHGHLAWRRTPYDYGRFDNGRSIPDAVRVLYRDSGLAAVHLRPFAVGANSLYSWLCAPWAPGPRITNLAAALRARQPGGTPRGADDDLTLLLDAQSLAERHALPDEMVTPAPVPTSTGAARSPSSRWTGPSMVGPESGATVALVAPAIQRACAHAAHQGVCTEDVRATYWLGDADGANPIRLAGATEVWAPSTAAVARLVQTVHTPVICLPHPVGQSVASSRSRAAFGIGDDHRLLVVAVDPLTHACHDLAATVQLFSAARARVGTRATLVLTTLDDARLAPSVHATIAPLTTDHLRWLPLALDDLLQLLRLADGYVSLHSGVGADPWLAEALAFGRPAIVTHVGGTTDVATPNNSFLVPTRSIVDTRPDEADAVVAIADVLGDPVTATARGARGRRDLQASHSLEAIAALVGTRLAVAASPRLPTRLETTCP